MNETIKLYCLYDLVAERGGPVWQAVNDAVAVRQSVNLLRESVDYNDYQLRQVGFYDDQQGRIVALDVPVVVDFAPALHEAIQADLKITEVKTYD